MAITASMVKELREMTGAGMMDCKKALNETNGDMDAAVEFLRKNGQAKAEKKASRIAAEGVARAAISADGKTACVIEVNSETDFVAKNETFTSFVEAVNETALASDLQGGKDGEDIEALLAVPFEGATVKDALVEKTATIGEKLSIRRFEKVAGDVAVSYIHGGGRIGVIVAANGASDDAAREALNNIAMQVAAMNPTYISRNDISAEELAKLQEITVDAALNDPASLPKPILNKLIDKAMNSSAWSDEDKAIYEEKKSNMNYLFNFLGWTDCRTHYLKIQRRLFRETGRELDRADYEKLSPLRSAWAGSGSPSSWKLSVPRASGWARCGTYRIVPTDYRLSIDRRCLCFKRTYALRTECERYNSRFKSTGQEQLWVRNGASAANLNTLAHISALAVALAAVLHGSHSYRSAKQLRRSA